MFFEDDDLLDDFLEESFDTIEMCNKVLEDITQGQNVSEGLAALFRGIHTIKGGSGMFSFEKTHHVAHSLETFLDELKKANPSSLDGEQIHFIQLEIDKLEKLLKSRDQIEIDVDEKNEKTPLAHKKEDKAKSKSLFFEDFYENFDQLFDDFDSKKKAQFELIVPASVKQKTISILEKMGCDCLHENTTDAGAACLFVFNRSDLRELEEVLEKMSFIDELNWIKRFDAGQSAEPFPSEEAESKVEQTEKAPRPVSSPSEMLRVPLDRVNKVLDNAWEMFLLSNQMSYLIEQHRPELKKNVAFMQAFESLETQMKRNIEEVEARVMSMRMNNIANTFNRMKKVVRGYSQESGKEIDFVTFGEHIELDKKVIDMISEPLIHLVRNAMDHGIEDANTRESLGKKKVGRIELKAYVNGNSAFIEISDDGKGMNPSKILESAKKKGLDVSKISDDQEALELIFKAGFSTAQEVSAVSGRGVGMDAVKTSVESLGGKLSLETKEGKGSIFKIELPMGMSVIQALVVKVNSFLYAFNSESILKTQRVSIFDIKKNGEQEFFLYNDEYIPCLPLENVFVNGEVGKHGPIYTTTSVCVVKSGDDVVAIRVNEVLQSVGLVAKPAPKLSPKSPYIGAVSLLQSGHPVIILSVDKIVQEHLSAKGPRSSHESKCA